MTITRQQLLLPHLRVSALVAGPEDGPPVVLLHGFPELSDSWREVMPALAATGLRVVAPDLRGYGATEKPAHGYDMTALTGDAVALIDELGGSAHVVGHDWGGLIAFDLAARHPERVRTLTVVNAPHPIAMAKRIWHARQLWRSWYVLLFQLPWLPERLVSRGRGRHIPAMLRGVAADAARLDDARLAPYVAAFATAALARPPLEYYRRALWQLYRATSGDAARRYPRISAPFLLIWGLEDPALDRELTADLDAYFAQPVRVSYLPAVGHSPPLEAPAQVAGLILQHVRDHASRTK